MIDGAGCQRSCQRLAVTDDSPRHGVLRLIEVNLTSSARRHVIRTRPTGTAGRIPITPSNTSIARATSRGEDYLLTLVVEWLIQGSADLSDTAQTYDEEPYHVVEIRGVLTG